jgi:DNA-binding transcriptional LysR family regulator
MDSLNGFVVFVQVAEMRSFVAAGRHLGVSASAVGKSIARLEDKLGVRLFHRSTRSITLTAEGHLLLERSRRILAEIEAAQQELTQAAERPVGRLRLSLPLVGSLVLPVLGDFMRQYPQIQLDLEFTDRMVDVIAEGYDAVLRIVRLLTRASCPQTGAVSHGCRRIAGLSGPLRRTAKPCGSRSSCLSAIPFSLQWQTGTLGDAW